MSTELFFINNNCKYYKARENDNTSNFFKNDVKILNHEKKPIQLAEFKNLIKEEINHYIYPFDNIVVLAGAGSSIVSDINGKPDSNYGYTMSMLSENIFEELNNPNFYSIDELSNFCKYSIPIQIPSSDEKMVYNINFNLEDFLSKVITFEEFIEDTNNKIDKKKYKKSKTKILQIIKNKTSYGYNIKKHQHASLIKVLSSLHKAPNRLTIVTTNYDTLFEEAANYLNFTVFDGFSFDSKATFDIDLFDWSFVRPILNIRTEKLEYKKSVINILKIHGSLTWKKKDEEILRVKKENNIFPLMIFPSSNKYSHSYEKPYFELFSKFQEILKKPNTLFLTTGFSFFDNHISKMITQAIKSSPSLSTIVTDYSIDPISKCSNWNEIENLMKNGYRISFLKATLDKDLMDFFGDSNYDN